MGDREILFKRIFGVQKMKNNWLAYDRSVGRRRYEVDGPTGFSISSIAEHRTCQ